MKYIVWYSAGWSNSAPIDSFERALEIAKERNKPTWIDMYEDSVSINNEYGMPPFHMPKETVWKSCGMGPYKKD